VCCGSQACLLPSGDKVVVYGGEDSHRRPLGDVHVLDLQVRHCSGLSAAVLWAVVVAHTSCSAVPVLARGLCSTIFHLFQYMMFSK
jgi:hypothetical protein